MGLAGYKRHPEHKKLSLTKSGMRQAENEKNGLVENWEPWCDRVVQTLEAGAALTKRASFMSITNYKVKESLTIRTPLQSNDYTQEQLRYAVRLGRYRKSQHRWRTSHKIKVGTKK